MSVHFILHYVVRRLDKCKDKALFLNEKFATVFTKEDSCDVRFLDGYPFPDISPIDNQ